MKRKYAKSEIRIKINQLLKAHYYIEQDDVDHPNDEGSNSLLADNFVDQLFIMQNDEVDADTIYFISGPNQPITLYYRPEVVNYLMGL